MKKVILENYRKYDLPNKFSRDVTKEHWDLIFEEKRIDETTNKNDLSDYKSKDDLSNSFYLDDKKFKQKGEFYQNNCYQQYKNNNYQHKKVDWKSSNTSNHYSKNHTNQNISGHNFIKNPVNDFINRLEMSKENGFSIDRSYVKNDSEFGNIIIKDANERKFDSNLFKTMNDKNNFDEMAEYEYLEDPHKTILTKEIKKELDDIPTLCTDIQTNYNFRVGEKNKLSNSFTPFQIECLYKINEKLKYSKDEPLWYVYHTLSKSSFGPVSSTQLDEIYRKKNIDGLSDVRLIDIFKIKNKGSFGYFKLKDLENPNFLTDFVEPSSLLKLVEELNNLKLNEIINQNKVSDKKLEFAQREFNKDVNKKYKPKQKFVDLEDIINEPVRNEIIPIISKEKDNNKPIKVKVDKNQVKESDIIKIKNEKSVIDDEFEDSKEETWKDDKKVDNKTNVIKSKPGKKLKGKPVEINLATGFYTISKQEKEYEPIYICGDNTTKNK